MRRLLFSAAMFLCSLLSFAQFSGSGSGTENDPYLIFNPIQLNQLRNFLNQEGVYFKLMADIDLTEFLDDEYPTQGWLPVGNSTSPFCGILDGNGNTISGLIINRDNSDNIGLFGYTSSCLIRNLTLRAQIKGRNNVGGFIGCAACKSEYSYINSLEGCRIEGTINGNENVGGFIGIVNGSVKYETRDYKGRWVSATRYANVQAVSLTSVVQIFGSGNNIGGIIGCINDGSGDASECVVNNSTLNGIQYVGGIIGKGACSLNKCAYIGTISGDSYVGGICGRQDGAMTRCFVLSPISASGDYVGGMAGSTKSLTSISDCYYNGVVNGRDKVGGFVGYSESEIYHCQSISDVKGRNQVGGLVGCHNGTIKSCISHSKYITATSGEIGRIYGHKDDGQVGTMGSTNENKSYNRTIVISQGVAQDITDNEMNGSGVSATTLRLKATYVAMGWDFTDTWEIQETECYPYFKTQTAPPVITSQVVSGATTVSGKCIDGGLIALEIDGVKQQMISKGNSFSFTVSPLRAGHEVRISAKVDGKEQSYYTTEVVSFLGKGTEADPYQISTAADLSQVYRKGHYKLMSDIDLTDYINQYCGSDGWESIGREGSETIYFDGSGHKVSGLWCNSTRDNTGLFSCFANGYIKNLTVETAQGKQVKGGNYTGIIIGKLINGEMTNCKVTGSLADGTPVGGLMGKLDGGKVSRCQADVTINVSSEKSYIGALIGEVSGEVDQCLSYGTLTATGANSYVGGLIGLSDSGSTITNSYSSVITNSSLSAAGIVAYNYGIVDKCYATGNVYSKNYGAGVVGYGDGEGAVVKNCVAMNNKIDVTFESQSAQSGGYGQRIIGGIKNNAPAPEMNNYALKTMQVSVNNVAQKVYDDIMNGMAKTAAQLKAKATYEELGWDFSTIWKIEEGASYPYQTEIIAATDTDEPSNPDDPDNPETISVTDISNLTNAIYAQPTSSQPGYETTLTICLKNAQGATAYSFDLQLPEGVTLATNSDGDYQYTLSNRHNGHSETVNYQSASGVYSFAVLSLQSKELTGSDGAIWTLRLKVASNVANGDYAIKILNAKYSIASGSAKVSMPETVSKLTINQYKKGDVNNDGDTDIADAVCIVNHVVGIATPSFVEQAADLNNDGDVDIADAVRIVNLVVGKISALARSNSSSTKSATRANSSNTDEVYSGDVSAYVGKDCTISVSLKNAQATNAYSFDLVLPEGVSVATDEDGEFVYELSDRHNGHMSTLNYKGNNTYSFAILSLQSKELSGNDGAICTFRLNIDKTLALGKYNVVIKNAKYSLTSGASKVTLPESTSQIVVCQVGDVNVDGSVNASDIVEVVNFIKAGGYSSAADVDGDGDVDDDDVNAIVGIIMEK